MASWALSDIMVFACKGMEILKFFTGFYRKQNQDIPKSVYQNARKIVILSLNKWINLL